MDKLPSAVAPPTPKVETTPKPATEPTPAPAASSKAEAQVTTPHSAAGQSEPQPKRNPNDPKPGEKGYETFEQRIARRVKEADEANRNQTHKNAAEKEAADKAAKEAADKTAQTSKQVDAELSDDQFEAQIAEETKAFKGDKEARSWKELRYSERALKRQIKDMVPSSEKATLESQLAEARQQIDAAKQGPAADPQEVSQLRDEIAKLQKRDQEREGELTVAKVERTEAFQNTVTKPREVIRDSVEKIAKKYEIPARDLMEAITDAEANSDRIVELTEKMNRLDAAKIDNAVRDLLGIADKETTLRANAKEALDKISSRSAADVEAAAQVTREARQAAHTPAWDSLKQETGDVLTPIEGDTDDVKAWNQAQTDAEKFARDTEFSTLKPEIQAQTLQRAAVFPLLMGKMQALEQQVADANARETAALQRLEKWEKATPQGGADANTDPKAGDPANGEKDFVKRIEARIKGAGIS